MSLRIRQIVLAARDLDATVSQLQTVLGVNVCYHDPEVAKFGLENALMTIGHRGFIQFLEVVSPIQENTAAGRHLDRHGDSGYMLILQTDDLARDRAWFKRIGVRIVWDATHPDISAVHLHPKDIGAAIVSVDQPIPPEAWRWAGPDWQRHTNTTGAQLVVSTTIAANDPRAMAKQWSAVLGVGMPKDAPEGEGSDSARIDVEDGTLKFERGSTDVIGGFGISIPDPKAALERAAKLNLAVKGNTVTICGTRFELSA